MTVHSHKIAGGVNFPIHVKLDCKYIDQTQRPDKLCSYCAADLFSLHMQKNNNSFSHDASEYKSQNHVYASYFKYCVFFFF